MKLNISFEEFLDLLSDHIWRDGWYAQSERIMKYKTVEEVRKYLITHCYSAEETEILINTANDIYKNNIYTNENKNN